MKLTTLILFIVFSTSASAGIFDFFKSKPKIHPIDLPDEKSRMEYLREYDPAFYAQIKQAQDGIIEEGNSALGAIQDQHDTEWQRYEKEAKEAYTPEKYEQEVALEKQRRDAELKNQISQKEREVLDQYKVINGKLVNRADEIKLIKSQQDEIKLRKAVQQFQKEEGMQILRDDQKLNIGE